MYAQDVCSKFFIVGARHLTDFLQTKFHFNKGRYKATYKKYEYLGFTMANIQFEFRIQTFDYSVFRLAR